MCIELELWTAVDGKFVWMTLFNDITLEHRFPVSCEVRLRIYDDGIPYGSIGIVRKHDADGSVRVWFEACKAAWSFRP